LVYRQFILPAFTFSTDRPFLSYTSPNRMQRTLGSYLKEGDVVLSDLYTSWSVPVYTGAKIIALYHTSPHIHDNQERIQAIETFFNSATSSAARKRILEHYGVTHILLNFQIAGKNIEPALKEAGFEVIVHNDMFCLFAVLKDSHIRAATG